MDSHLLTPSRVINHVNLRSSVEYEDMFRDRMMQNYQFINTFETLYPLKYEVIRIKCLRAHHKDTLFTRNCQRPMPG
jgi:hypothetical protein